LESQAGYWLNPFTVFMEFLCLSARVRQQCTETGHGQFLPTFYLQTFTFASPNFRRCITITTCFSLSLSLSHSLAGSVVEWWASIHKGWRTFLRVYAQIVYKFERNSFACPWEFWRAL